MYQRFFGLRESPFNVNPDPRYLCLTPRVRESLAALTDGIQNRKGFILLTGEAGTGKTILLNRLLDWLRDEQMSKAFIMNPLLESAQLLGLIIQDFGIPCKSGEKSRILMRLNHWLLDVYRAGRAAVVIIDEAQNLSFEVLEEVRLLTNLETPRAKLLQVVLCGQPELEEKLKRPQLRQLRQRVTVRCRISSLSLEDTFGYIGGRLHLAGANGDPIFSKEAVQMVHKYSRGIPREINFLCEQSMIGAYVDHLRPVPARLVEEVARDFQLDEAVSTFAVAASGKSESATAQALINSLTWPP